MTITGTNHFKDIESAQKYYALYGKDYYKIKIRSEEIKIGKPSTKPGETLSVNDEGRYVIQST